MNILKQYWKTALLLSIGVISFIGCSNSHNSNATKMDLTKYADIKEYIVKVDYHDDHQSYIEIIVSNSDKRGLLTKFKFEDNLTKLKGRVEPSFVTENPNYIYYVKEDGEGPYGYVLYALEKAGNTLIKVFKK